DRILIIEDEQTILDSLTFSLGREGYQVTTAKDGHQGVEAFDREHPDAVLLDLMLGRTDGFDVLRKLRQTSDVPIIVLTAKDEETDKVCGLELGADDYVTKPFSMRELLARIKGHLRKHRRIQPPEPKSQLGELEIDWARAEILRGEVRIFLTSVEFSLLKVLYEHRERACTREWLLDYVWKLQGDSRVVDTTVKRLRQKLGMEVVETVRGLGYRLCR
ncbi:MAG TPA: response regulator transcription factor, partial [Candidatus Xenobia bacterium]